jgi:hypothetical protein
MSDSIAYYQERADINGVVEQARLEAIGLTSDSYFAWYLRSCRRFYEKRFASSRSAWNSIKKYHLRPASQTPERFTRWRKLEGRRNKPYITLHARQDLRSVISIYEGLIRERSNNHAHDAALAADKVLFSADRLHRLAGELLKEKDALRAARGAGINYDFNPEEASDTALATAHRLAIIQDFHDEAANFESLTKGAVFFRKGSLSAAIADPWTNLLQEDYTSIQLTRLLVSVGLLEDEISKAATADTAPQAWQGVIEALMRCKILDRKRTGKAIADAIALSYGQGLISVRTIQAGYSGSPLSESYCARALSFLRR